MRKLFSFLIARRSVVSLVVMLVILEGCFIARFFFPDAMKFVVERHLYEILVLLTLTQILVILSVTLWPVTPEALASEQAAQERIRWLLEKDGAICFVGFLSAGLRSRADFIRNLLETRGNLRIEVVSCFGPNSPNPDKLDRDQLGPADYEVITHRLNDHESKRLRVLRSLNRPSFRCVLLRDVHGSKYAIVGWYTYHNRDSQIVGRRNLQLFVDGRTDAGRAVLSFANRLYEACRREEEVQVLFDGGDVNPVRPTE